jgi:hypothetical protein
MGAHLELQTFSLPQLIVLPDVHSPRHYFRVIVSERRNSRHRLKANLSRGRDAKSGVSRSGDRPITEVRNNDLSIPGSILSPFFTKDLISTRILDLPIHPRRRALNSCEWFDNRSSFWWQFTGWHSMSLNAAIDLFFKQALPGTVRLSSRAKAALSLIRSQSHHQTSFHYHLEGLVLSTRLHMPRVRALASGCGVSSSSKRWLVDSRWARDHRQRWPRRL